MQLIDDPRALNYRALPQVTAHKRVRPATATTSHHMSRPLPCDGLAGGGAEIPLPSCCNDLQSAMAPLHHSARASATRFVACANQW